MSEAVSRRKFLFAFRPPAEKTEGRGKTEFSRAEEAWRSIGHVSAFPPVRETEVDLGGTKVVIRSLHEGLQAVCDGGGRCLQMKLRNDGHLFVNVRESWPEGSVLSILTGNRHQL